MAIDLLTRVKSFIDPIGTARELLPSGQKGIGDSNFPFFGYGSGLDTRNRDFTATEYGAAQASQLLVDIAAPLNVWEQWLDGLTWHIKDVNTGKTIISTDERRIPDDNQPGLRTFRAIKLYRDRFKHSYWKSIAMSDWIAGETYIWRVRNRSQIPTALQWLNPLATTPNIISGEIRDYQYNNDDMRNVDRPIQAGDMAYRMLRRNIFDDLRGYAPVMSIIDESNLSRNVKRAFRGYFRNGMILGGMISPDGEDIWTPRDQKNVEEQLFRNNRGADNAHSWIIAPRRINAEQFSQKDVSKDISILSDLRGSIMMAMGVPEELAGNPTNATYENLEATQYGWFKFKGIPYAKDIAEYHNNQIIPYLDGDRVYIEPELSKYEIERPEVVSQDVSASVISLYDAQVKRGQTEADEKLKDIYIVNNRPMHRDIIIKLANTMPSEEIEQLANAEASIAGANAPAGSSDELAPVDMTVQYDENGTAIPQTEVFGYHIESGIVDVNEARAQLGLPPLEKESATDTDLVQLNSQLQTVITAINAGMGIEEAYESVGLEPPKEDKDNDPPPPPSGGNPFQQGKSVTISHGDHDHTLPVDDSDTFTPDKALAELKAWTKFRKNDAKRVFTPQYLLGDIADSILSATDTDSAFDSAFEMVKGWQKAIQAVRIDFEDSIEDLLVKARDDSNNFGRVQWSSAMRKIIRRACTRAYSDGLINGGVLDGELSESDEDILAAHIADQSRFVSELGAKIFKTEDGISDALADRKPAMWFNKSVMPMFDAGRESADANGMYEFAGQDGEKSCSTCPRLKGQRHRFKSWSRKGLRPGVDTDNFECGGWQCKHKLVKVAASARGNW